MATITVQASGVTAPDNWTLKAGASKVAAVNQPDDDATSYIESSTSFPTYQTFTLTPALSAGDTITQVVVHARARRGGASDCNFIMSYAFTPQGGGSQTGSSGTLTAGTNFANFSFTDSGLSVLWGSDFTIYARNTQARNLDFTTFYAVITYTPAPTNQTLTGAHIASTAAVYTPVKLTKKLAGATIAGGVTMYAPAKVTKKLAGATIASTAALYAPAKLSRKIAGASIASTVTLYAPSSVSVADAPTVITGVHIASTATLYAPAKLALRVTGATIASTAAVKAGMVHRGSIHIVNVTTYAQGDISSASFEHETPEGNNRLLIVASTYYNTAGASLGAWGVHGTGDGEFDIPNGIAVGAGGSVYVADSGNNRVQKFDADGVFIAKWGSYGIGNGEFKYPCDVAVGPDGSVYVADLDNRRIQKFDADGVFITKWGSYGSGDGQFVTPIAIAVGADGSVYVAEFDNNRVQKFDADGVFIAKWGSYGIGNGEFKYPNGIAVGPDGSVYVADLYNRRIQKFDADGVFITKWGSYGSGDGQFVTPDAVAVGADGSVYTGGSNRIQKFNASGVFIARWGIYGTGDGEFDGISGIAIAPDGTVYTVELDGERVQIFPADLYHNVARYNNVDMSIGPAFNSGSYSQVFYTLINPPIGTYTISLVSPTEPNAFIVTAISCNGVEGILRTYTEDDAGAVENELNTVVLQVSHNRAYLTNTLSLFLLLYETEGTILTAAADNWIWQTLNVGTLHNTLGFRPTPTATTSNLGFGVTANPAVTSKVSAVLHLEAVRGNPQPPVIAATATLYPPARVALPGQTLDGATIASAAAVNAPAMMTKLLAGAHITTTAAAYTPAQVGHRLGGSSIAATVLNAPAVGVGTRALALPAFATSTTLYAGALPPGGVTLAGEYVALSPTVHTPAAVVPGAVRILARPPDIATQVMAPARVVNFRYMTPPRIESTAVLYAPAGAASNTVIYVPHIGEGLPKAINAPHIALLAIHVFVLRMRIYATGATVAATTVVHAPTAITVGEDLWLGRVFPPEEVEVV